MKEAWYKQWFDSPYYNILYQNAIKTQTNLIQILDNEQALYQPFLIINAIWVKGDFDLIQKIATQSEVERIFYNSPIKGADPVEIDRNVIVNSRDSSVWGIKKINADDVWALGFEGQGIVVGGQDTGYGWQVPGIKDKFSTPPKLFSTQYKTNSCQTSPAPTSTITFSDVSSTTVTPAISFFITLVLHTIILFEDIDIKHTFVIFMQTLLANMPMVLVFLFFKLRAILLGL